MPRYVISQQTEFPFEITPMIKRYLEDIVYLHDEWLQGNIFYLLEITSGAEVMTFRQRQNAQRFWDYLEENRIVNILRKPTVDELKNIIGQNARGHFAIARDHEDERKPVKFYSAIHQKQKIDDVLEQIVRASRAGYTSNIGKTYLILKMHDVRPIKKLLEKSEEKSSEDESDKNVAPIQSIYQDSKVRFDSQSGIVKFKDNWLKFHKGDRGEKPRLLLFKKLWPERKCIKNGEIKTKGRLSPADMLAVQLNIVGDAYTFNQGQRAKNILFGLVKGINRELKKKDIPAKIERKNGVQLVITEK